MFISIYDSKYENASAETLGGKGYGLWWMQQQGVNVPPALILPTSVCCEYMKDPEAVMAAVEKELPFVYGFFDQQFGYMPLVSVRSGARVSMPGMMDTILNVGLDDSNVSAWADRIGGACAKDSRERLITMYANVVKGQGRDEYAHITSVAEAEVIYKAHTGEDFPAAKAQLLGAIEAVFKSWNNERAKVYRAHNGIPEDWGTAVVIQAMVFGNFNDKSGTGVLFTRNPDTGANEVTGEFLINAQGEDVVAGIRTPMPLKNMMGWNKAVAQELLDTVEKLEALKKDVQDVEFTVQDGKLFILQTRNAKRSARAAVKIALDMYVEGELTREEALKRVSPRQYDLAQQPVIDPTFKKKPAFFGIPGCTGVVTGKVVLSAEAAIKCKEPCILVTKETTPDDLAGMIAARGVLTMEGGMTSHAAVVARAMNKACVVGLTQPLSVFAEGKVISIDGATGAVWLEAVPVIDPTGDDLMKQFHALLYADAKLVPYFDLKAGIPAGVERAVVRLVDMPHSTAEEAAALFHKLASSVDVLYVDMTLDMEKHEDSFYVLLGVSMGNADAKALLEFLDKQAYASKIVSIDRQDKATKNLGRITVADTEKDMVLAKNPVIFSGNVNDPYIQRLLELKAAAGEDVEAMGVVGGKGRTFASNGKLLGSLLG